MLSPGKGGSAPVYGHVLGHATYERHRPEDTLLYQLVEKHYPALVEQLEFQGKSLPPHGQGVRFFEHDHFRCSLIPWNLLLLTKESKNSSTTMARLPRLYAPGCAHHIIQRGNNRATESSGWVGDRKTRKGNQGH